MRNSPVIHRTRPQVWKWGYYTETVIKSLLTQSGRRVVTTMSSEETRRTICVTKDMCMKNRFPRIYILKGSMHRPMRIVLFGRIISTPNLQRKLDVESMKLANQFLRSSEGHTSGSQSNERLAMAMGPKGDPSLGLSV